MSEQNDEDPNSRNAAADGAWAGLAGVGAVALVIGCCGGLPLLAALAGSLAVGTFVGIGAAAVVLVALVGFIVLRARRGTACATSDDPPPEQSRADRPTERIR